MLPLPGGRRMADRQNGLWAGAPLQHLLRALCARWCSKERPDVRKAAVAQAETIGDAMWKPANLRVQLIRRYSPV